MCARSRFRVFRYYRHTSRGSDDRSYCRYGHDGYRCSAPRRACDRGFAIGPLFDGHRPSRPVRHARNRTRYIRRHCRDRWLRIRFPARRHRTFGPAAAGGLPPCEDSANDRRRACSKPRLLRRFAKRYVFGLRRCGSGAPADDCVGGARDLCAGHRTRSDRKHPGRGSRPVRECDLTCRARRRFHL